MIDAVWKVPQTAESRLFCLAAEKWNLNDRGYEESEYFFSGSANVYERSGSGRQVLVSDAPYVNRMIVRAPKNRAEANGVVVVEILNSTAFIDLDRCFLLVADKLMADGAIYVGITSKPCVLPALRRYDPQRYAPLNWNNPRVCTEPAETLGNFPGASSPKTEDGLFWDMLRDLGRLLGSGTPADPLAGYPCRAKILAGWSQSGAYMVRYLQDFAGEDRCFDGYFSCGSAVMSVPRLNQSDPVERYSRDYRLPLDVVSKMVEMHTESENRKLGNHAARLQDAENYRIYDVAGPSHDTLAVSDAYYRCDPWVWKCGIIPNYRGQEPYINDFPYELAFSAAYDGLCRWVLDGEAPIHTDPIAFDDNLENIRDDSGNVVGGWRLPQIELPVAAYYDWSTPLKPDFAFGCALYGHRELYGAEKLKTLYGSPENYLALVEEKADACIAGRLLLAQQKQACLQHAEQSVWQAWV